MKRVATILILFVALPAHAGFNEVLGDLEGRLGHSMWIPFFGLVRSVVRVGHPEGVHDVQLAVFEGKGRLDPDDLQRVMNRRAGNDYVPLVRVRSRRGRESSFIYVRPIGDKLDLLVLTNDSEDTVLVRVVVNPEAVGRYLNENPKGVVQIARR